MDLMWGLLAQQFLKQSAMFSGKRSTVMSPMLWLAAMTLLSSVSVGIWSDKTWLAVGLFVLGAATIVTAIGSYLYLSIKNPDALRSEQFVNTQTALEKTMIGDNTGIFTVDTATGRITSGAPAEALALIAGSKTEPLDG